MRGGVAQSVQCLTTDWTAGVRSLTEAENFSSNLCVQTGSGAHPASCTVGTGGSFPGGKARPGRDADHSPPSSAEVKKEQELYLLSQKCASMERNGTTLPFFTVHSLFILADRLKGPRCLVWEWGIGVLYCLLDIRISKASSF
jgi:hypothetical protein